MIKRIGIILGLVILLSLLYGLTNMAAAPVAQGATPTGVYQYGCQQPAFLVYGDVCDCSDPAFSLAPMQDSGSTAVNGDYTICNVGGWNVDAVLEMHGDAAANSSYFDALCTWGNVLIGANSLHWGADVQYVSTGTCAFACSAFSKTGDFAGTAVIGAFGESFTLYANAANGASCSGPVDVNWSYSLTLGEYPGGGGGEETPTLTPTPTPTPTVPSDLQIIDLFPCQGTNCLDWNLRSGCGNNDLWIRVYTASGQVAGQTVNILDANQALVCTYTFPASVQSATYKYLFLDEMRQPDNTACLSWPVQGYIAINGSAQLPYDTVGHCGEIVINASSTPVYATPSSATRTPTATPTTTFTPGPTPTPSVTRTPVGFTPAASNAAGLVVVRQFDTTVTPLPGQIGSHLDVYWDDIQPVKDDSFNWTAVDNRIDQLAAQGLKTWLSLQFFECAWGATPDVPYLPSGVPTVTYTAGVCGTEYAPRYNSATFQTELQQAVAAMTARYKDDPDVAGYRIQAGCSGEATNVYNQSVGGVTCPNRAGLEATVSCDDYYEFVEQYMDWWRQGEPLKPLYINTGIAACSSRSDTATIRDIMAYAAARNIGYGYNGLQTGSVDAYRQPNTTPYPYGRYQYGALATPGSSFEPGAPYGFPTQIPTARQPGFGDDMLLAGAGNGATNLFVQKQWWPEFSAPVVQLITGTLGVAAADAETVWLRFRDWEYGQNNPAGYQKSDVPGPYSYLVTVRAGPTPTQVCSAAVATAAAGIAVTPPKPCPAILTATPSAEGRNNLRYAASTTLGLDIADDWQYAGVSADFDIQLTYLDSSSDSLTVVWPGGSQIITKTNTLTWQTATIPLTDVTFANDLAGADVQIQMGAGAETLHLVTVRHYATGRGNAWAWLSRQETVATATSNWHGVALGVAGGVLTVAAGIWWKRRRRHAS